MRLAIALAVLVGCKFPHGTSSDNPGGDDADMSDSPLSDSLTIDTPTTDGSTMLDASTVTPLLRHDFETDLIGPYTAIYLMSNDAVNHSSTAHTGTKSAHCVTANPAEAQATLYFNFQTRAQLYASMWIRPSTGFPPSDYVMIMTLVDDPAGIAWNNVAQVSVFPDMRVGVYNNAQGQETLSTATLTVNQWHRIEVLYKVSTNAGRAMLAIDGVVQFDMKNIDTGSLQFHRILTGIAWQGDPGDATALYLDDVRLE
ncbi:MAG TPA: hypothetical protein VIV11_16400 [Kofleriaceae bacterium]